MTDTRPGLNLPRLLHLMQAAIASSRLDLTDRVVMTEAASGAYVVTPVLAAMAGAAEVIARTRATRYGTVDQITDATLALAELAGVRDRIRVVAEKTHEDVARADIITNSGHLRPLDADAIGWMKPSAVIPLMFEAWEYRPGDLDLDAARRKGIAVAGTNERHPAVDVFSYLGVMAVKLLLDAGVAVYGSTILLLCDNPFSGFIERGLSAAGAHVLSADSVANARFPARNLDAVLVALRPAATPVLTAADACLIAGRWPGAVIAQYWGDVDRDALTSNGLTVWPPQPPPLGHMGILPSGVGPEPIVRLQAGGLKVGEVLLKPVQQRTAADLEYLDELAPSLVAR